MRVGARGSSDAHGFAKGRHPLLADAGHVDQCVHGCEGLLHSVRDDFLRRLRPDTGQGFQFLSRCVVEIDKAVAGPGFAGPVCLGHRGRCGDSAGRLPARPRVCRDVEAGGETAWLDPKRTSPYRFYQFWLNIDDADVVNYLKYFTWLTRPEIMELEHAVDEHPERREAQRKLAREMTLMVHGETALANAEQASSVLFGGDLDGLSAADIEDIFADVPSNTIARAALGGEGIPVVDLLVNSDLATGKGDARRSIDGGGIYLNNQRVSDPAQMATTADAIEGQFIVLRKGRKRYHLVQVMD